MIYPAFLTPGKTVGITAPSAGAGHKLTSYDRSLAAIRGAGYDFRETASVRVDGFVSADAKTRATELMSLVNDPSVDMLMMATGGDFMMEILPYLDFEAIRRHPKWMQGYSDVTNLLYPVTTLLDIATIYGPNAGGYEDEPLHPYQTVSLDLLSGKLPTQYSADMCEPAGTFDAPFTDAVCWKAINGDFTAEGRLLGGCLDCLAETVAGTRFDGTKDFIHRHREDGIIWYFDIFSLSAEQTARALWRLAEYGWFHNAAAFIFGRVVFPSTFLDITYEQAILRELGHNSKIVTDADVGHRPPVMTMVNGALARLTVENSGGNLSTAFV